MAMRWSRTLQTVDVHCEGEVGRVITGGALGVPGASMADKLRHLNEVDDGLRRWLCSEPRSSPAGSFVLVLPSTREDADAGMVVLQPDRAHAMSGSNAICTVTALLETGMVAMREPQTVVTLDTAAGLVRALADCADGKVVGVSLDMPPAFSLLQDARVVSPVYGELRYDLCFGGVFYALVDVEQLGLAIVPEQARELASAGVALHALIDAEGTAVHPDSAALNGLAYVMFRSVDEDGAVRTCTTMRPGRVDRSPCGTGSTAQVAALHARGAMQVGDRLLTRSTIGGEFRSHLFAETEVGGRTAVRNRVTGRAWIYAISQIGLDPSDPFPAGFRVADTWGG